MPARPSLPSRRSRPSWMRPSSCFASRRRPATSRMESVSVRITDEIFPTYLPLAPDPNPMFLEKRVYQGRNGRVYPLPLPTGSRRSRRPRAWKAVCMENEYLRVMILPEIGGRIHASRTRPTAMIPSTTRRSSSRRWSGWPGPGPPAGSSSTGPSTTGPATFMPAEYAVEEHADGAATVWLGDHNLISRLKGMHGVRLLSGPGLPGTQGARLPTAPRRQQTFLWWANARDRAHELYQSFFPPDVPTSLIMPGGRSALFLGARAVTTASTMGRGTARASRRASVRRSRASARGRRLSRFSRLSAQLGGENRTRP